MDYPLLIFVFITFRLILSDSLNACPKGCECSDNMVAVKCCLYLNTKRADPRSNRFCQYATKNATNSTNKTTQCKRPWSSLRIEMNELNWPPQAESIHYDLDTCVDSLSKFFLKGTKSNDQITDNVHDYLQVSDIWKLIGNTRDTRQIRQISIQNTHFTSIENGFLDRLNMNLVEEVKVCLNPLLEKLPVGWLTRVKNLKILDLQRNKLTEVSLAKWGIDVKNSKLNMINLSGNRIDSLSDKTFENLEHLSSLFLDDNMISSLKASTFNKLDKLKTLSLKGNALTIPTLSGSLLQLGPMQMIGLNQLYLSNNPLISAGENGSLKLHEIDWWLAKGCPQNLQKLEMAEVGLSSVKSMYPKIFWNKCTSLKIVNVAGNPQLKCLPQAWLNLPPWVSELSDYFNIFRGSSADLCEPVTTTTTSTTTSTTTTTTTTALPSYDKGETTKSHDSGWQRKKGTLGTSNKMKSSGVPSAKNFFGSSLLLLLLLCSCLVIMMIVIAICIATCVKRRRRNKKAVKAVPPNPSNYIPDDQFKVNQFNAIPRNYYAPNLNTNYFTCPSVTDSDVVVCTLSGSRKSPMTESIYTPESNNIIIESTNTNLNSTMNSNGKDDTGSSCCGNDSGISPSLKNESNCALLPNNTMHDLLSIGPRICSPKQMNSVMGGIVMKNMPPDALPLSSSMMSLPGQYQSPPPVRSNLLMNQMQSVSPYKTNQLNIQANNQNNIMPNGDPQLRNAMFYTVDSPVLSTHYPMNGNVTTFQEASFSPNLYHVKPMEVHTPPVDRGALGVQRNSQMEVNENFNYLNKASLCQQQHRPASNLLIQAVPPSDPKQMMNSHTQSALISSKASECSENSAKLSSDVVNG